MNITSGKRVSKKGEICCNRFFMLCNYFSRLNYSLNYESPNYEASI